MGGKAYDFLKFLALVILPAMAGFYFALGQFWPLPEVERVVGTITAFDAFLGVIISKASSDFLKKNAPAKVMGDIVMLQYPNGEIERPVIKPYAEVPIFPVDGFVGFKVKREPIPEPDHTQE